MIDWLMSTSEKEAGQREEEVLERKGFCVYIFYEGMISRRGWTYGRTYRRTDERTMSSERVVVI